MSSSKQTFEKMSHYCAHFFAHKIKGLESVYVRDDNKAGTNQASYSFHLPSDFADHPLELFNFHMYVDLLVMHIEQYVTPFCPFYIGKLPSALLDYTANSKVVEVDNIPLRVSLVWDAPSYEWLVRLDCRVKAYE